MTISLCMANDLAGALHLLHLLHPEKTLSKTKSAARTPRGLERHNLSRHLREDRAGDAVRGGDEHAVEVVDVSAGDGAGRVAEQGGNRRFGEAEVACNGGEGMPQRVRGDAVELRGCRDPAPGSRHPAERPLAARRRQHEGATALASGTGEHVEGSAADRADRRPFLRLGQPEAPAGLVDLAPAQVLDLAEPAPGQGQEPGATEGLRGHGLGLGCGEHLPKPAVLVGREAPLPPLIGRPLHPLCRVEGYDALGHRERQDAAQQARGPRRGAGAALHDGLAPQPPRALDDRRLAGGHVPDEARHLGRCHVPHQLRAQQRLDVPLDPAAVDVEGGGLLRPTALAHHQALLGRVEVAVAKLAHGERLPPGDAVLLWVLAARYVAQEAFRLAPRLVDRDRAVGADLDPPGAAGGAVLREVDLASSRPHPHPEPGELVVPDEVVRGLGLQPVDHPLRQPRQARPRELQEAHRKQEAAISRVFPNERCLASTADLAAISDG